MLLWINPILKQLQDGKIYVQCGSSFRVAVTVTFCTELHSRFTFQYIQGQVNF